MHVDTRGAIEIARLGARFDWRWTLEDVARFCAAVGWHASEQWDVFGRFVTNLSIDDPTARFSVYEGELDHPLIPGETVEYLLACVTDTVDDDDPALPHIVIDAFAELSHKLSSFTLGPPSSYRPGEMPCVSWEFPAVVATLLSLREFLVLKFENPAYREWIDQLDEDDHDGPELEILDPGTSWSSFSATLSKTLVDLPSEAVINVSSSNLRFLQIAYWHREADGQSADGFELRCNIDADPSADGRHLNRPEIAAGLASSGWQRIENRHGNFWRLQIDWPARYDDICAVVEKIGVALRDYFNIESPSQLQLELIY
ncbi:DUF6301 family protein [Nocardia sp. NBC_01327]|uniref:DUF6301 family protein n=1 Tax=Nocardia sp. NBC_01327 TaxID=2903593 RepID=UPI002E152D55|nr:DUF6301 family protein [Nocardia sp. NBC_01327]